MITVSKGLPGGGNSELPITGGIKQKLANQVGTVEGIHHQGYILTSRIPSHAKNETCQNQDLILDDLILVYLPFWEVYLPFSTFLFVPLTLNYCLRILGLFVHPERGWVSLLEPHKPVLGDSSVCMLTQSCQILCNPMGYSPSSSSAHGVLQGRVLEWVAISSHRRSSWSRGWTCVSCVSCIGRWILYHHAIWEAPGE